ncbi:DNA circularization N-terminal domain-containing protein [Rhodoferax sp.]|uniref:DNA circularization protein n=1 Tax=Rhodoferax sp. TaxID=50421 RepID=UPI00284EDCFA|nr:DNA circularization N-terminal domain-containing protein [Rhodoferax sp.]MDR3370721.1 DNA circularization N-terminal domain-containing protein [Rhodoferax sp.]
MSWVDQLQMASFRDVTFQVDSIDVSAGDNVVLREYPFQDLPTVFRMGEAAEEIKFSAYVIGDDYIDQRERLRAVLTGEGVLVHPTAGSMRVFVAGKFTIKENPTAEGGMARFDLTFVRAETRRYPAGVVSTPQESFRKGELAKQASADAFASAFDLTGKPGWVADRMVARITDSVAGVWGQIKSVTAGVTDFSNTIIGNYQALRDGLNSLVRQPRLLADSLRNLFALPSDLSAASARDFMAAFEGLFDVSSKVTQRDFEVSVMPAVGAGLVMYGTGNADVLGLSTPARAQLDALTTASDQLIESLAVASWVQAASVAELTSYDDALALRAALNAQCTRLLLRASTAAASDGLPDSAWHDAMLALLTAGLRDIQERSRDMTRLQSFTPQAWMPVWYVSYRLFGTAAYADEILAMNPHITHPLLVPPGKALRVMRHD